MICPHCGKEVPVTSTRDGEFVVADFKDWIAIPDEDYDGEPQRWCITTKAFWDKHHHLDDGDRIPNIPKFGECMENVYEYLDGDLSIEQQADLLRSYGFNVLPVEDWAK